MKIFEINDGESMHDAFAEVLKQPFFEHNAVDIDNVLVHYTDYVPKGGFEKRTLAKRTKPRDTSSPIHDYLNELSKEKFGVEVRSETLFAYSSTHGNQDIVNSAEYGVRTIVVPIGDYTLFHVPGVHDFTDYYDPHFATEKYGFIVNMIRKSPAKIQTAHDEIYNIVEPELEGQLDEDRQERQIQMFIGNFLHMISVDFTSAYQSDGLVTLQKEIPDIAHVIVKEVVEESGFKISDKAKNQIAKMVEWLIESNAKHELSKYQEYIDNMEATKKVEPFGDDEYMLYCKEFYIFDYQEFYEYLLKVS